MKQNLPFKIILLATGCAVVFGTFSTYAFYTANKNDPDLVAKIEKAVSERYQLKNFRIVISGQDAYAGFADTTSTSTFSGAAQEIEINAVAADVEVRFTDGDKIIVKAKGELAENAKSKNIVIASFDGETIQVDEPDDGSTKNVKIDVFIPKNFSKDLTIDAVSGNIHIEKLQFQKLKVNTVSGEITIFDDRSQNLELNSVSGTIKLNVKQPDLLKIETGTISGKIKNSYKTSSQGTVPVEIHTVSGDIHLE